MQRPLRTAVAFSVASLLALAFAGCSKQGEGERCDTKNGSADCDTGLVCTAVDELLIGSSGGVGALCCPPNGGEGACVPSGGSIGGDAGDLPGPDGGVPDATMPDVAAPDVSALPEAAAPEAAVPDATPADAGGG